MKGVQRALVAVGLVALAAGCSPAPTAKKEEAAPVAAAPQPPAALAESFKDCTWGEARGGGVSLWGFSCAGVRLVGDDALPGIVLEASGDGGALRTPVVRVFEIPAGAAIDAALPAVRAASSTPDIAQCAFAPSTGSPGAFELKPTGALLEKYNQFIEGRADEPSMPCGQLGPSEAGGRYFRMVPGAPTKVAVIYMPSDIAPFDSTTLRAAP